MGVPESSAPWTLKEEVRPRDQSQDPPDKRVLGVLPNYRTANETAMYTPITAEQKLVIGAKDSFDYPLVLLAGVLAAAGEGPF